MSERLSDYDADAIRRRLTEGDKPEDSVTTKDVAEVTGLSLEEVEAHLDRIRAEKAFVPAPKPSSRNTWIAAVAVGVIVTVCGLYLLGFARSEAEPPNTAANLPKLPRPAIPAMGVRESPVGSLRDVSITFGPGIPSPGIRTQVAGAGTSFTADAHIASPVSHHRFSYAAQCALLESSIRYLAWRLADREDAAAQPVSGMKVMDANSNVYEPRAGQYHFSIGGDCKAVDGFLTLKQIERGALAPFVKQALAGHESDKGAANEVLPPAGYSVFVGGRLQLSASGPLVGEASKDAAATLAKAVTAMIEWDAEEGGEKTLPAARVSIYASGGESNFEVPLTPTGAITEEGRVMILRSCKVATSKRTS